MQAPLVELCKAGKNAEARFAVIFDYDMTRRSLGGKRFRSHEVALYTVKNDKIIREEFFYSR